MKIDPGKVAKGIRETVSNEAGEVHKATSEGASKIKEQVQQSSEQLKQAGQKTAEDRKGSMNLSAGILAQQLSGAAEKSTAASGGGNAGTQSASSSSRKKMKPIEDGSVPTNPMDVRNLKPNIDLKKISEKKGGTTGEHRTDGVHGLDPKTTIGHPDGGHIKIKGGLRGLENHTIDTGLNNRGTFGDERLNRGRQTDPNDYRGSGAGTTSRKGKEDPSTNWKQTGSGTDDKGNPFTVSKNGRGDTMTNWQTDSGEVTLVQRKDGTSLASFHDKDGLLYRTIRTEKDGSQVISTWYAPVNGFITQKVKMPNPDADDSGNWKPVELKGTNPGREMKGAKKPGGQAGGADDGRNPDATPAGGSSEQSSTSILMGATGGQEAKQVEAGGTINFDKVLEINTKINPTRD